jgi:hypothetical protein
MTNERPYNKWCALNPDSAEDMHEDLDGVARQLATTDNVVECLAEGLWAQPCRAAGADFYESNLRADRRATVIAGEVSEWQSDLPDGENGEAASDLYALLGAWCAKHLPVMVETDEDESHWVDITDRVRVLVTVPK